MTSPGQQALSQVRIQSGEAQAQYAPTELAYRVQNLEMTPRGDAPGCARCLPV